MKIAVLRELADGETRVAATPETVSKFKGLGAEVAVEAGAGAQARIPDADYAAAGATIGKAAETIKGADIVLTVRRPRVTSLNGVNPGALVIGAMDPYGNEAEIAALAKAGVTAIAMEFMPRITRAQVMDILSSQANLAGYQAVIDAAQAFDRAMPMMMTAAGTVRPAKVFVMGAGVAGLQAIATARRLGAVVTATDVRAAAGEQVESLGAKFIMTEALKDASGSGGYARELTPDEQTAQADLVAGHIAKQDIVITTALIPGRPAPKLVSKAMVESMAPGSVIVDLAAERGGNVELTQPGKAIVTTNGVTILAYTNVPGRLATSASQLYARNLNAFLETLVDKKEQKLAVNWDDELVKATVLTRDGAIVHPNIKLDAVTAAPAPAVKPAGPPAKTVPVAQAATPPRPPAAAPVAPEAAVVTEAVVAEAVPAAPVKTGAAKKTTAKKAAAPAGITDVPPLPAAKAPAKRTAKTAVATSEAAAPKPARKPAAKKPAASKGTT
ncbi:MAG: Re/Si-specific NAD(P)(+) transhydrogenase subunit alpha [Devosia sp.]